eukprot:s1007_g11.t1
MEETTKATAAVPVAKGARLAKLLKAAERLVSCSVADILKQDFEVLFDVALSPNDLQSLQQMKTWMAATFADKAHKAQSEAMWELQIADFLARLDMQAEAPMAEEPLPEELVDASTAVKESAGTHELQAKLQLLRKHLQQQELANQSQEKSIIALQDEIEAAHAKLDRDTSQLLAELCSRNRATWK